MLVRPGALHPQPTPSLPPSLPRRFHVNPKAERVEPVNMDTADILGDMYVKEKRERERESMYAGTKLWEASCIREIH